MERLTRIQHKKRQLLMLALDEEVVALPADERSDAARSLANIEWNIGVMEYALKLSHQPVEIASE